MTRTPAEGRTHPGDTWSWAAALALTAFFLATSLYIAAHRLFWYDEVFTVLFARLPDVASIWRALLGGADLHPLPFYLVVRASEAFFGRSELAARLPSAVAMSAGLLVTFDCARRLTGGLFGLIALAALTCSFLPFYGYEARPYALLFLFSALILWLWLTTQAAGKGVAYAFGGLCLASAMVHVYAIFCLTPYAVYELLQRRRPSWKLIGGALGTGLGLALLTPQLLAGHRRVTHPSWWARPSAADLQQIFERFFPYGLFLFALVMLLATVIRFRVGWKMPPMPEGERIGWLFLLIPVAGYTLAATATQAFYERYFISALPGIAVALASLLHRHFAENPRVAAGILVLFTALGVSHHAPHVIHPEQLQVFGDQQGETRELIAREQTFLKDGRNHIAVHVAHLAWLSAWYYSSHRERYVAIGEPDTVCRPLSQVEPTIHCWTGDELRQHARETAVVWSLDEVQRALGSGLQVTLREAYPLQVFYLQ